MACGIQWPLKHFPNHKKNYNFIYFGMPPKMDDINVFFIFIFIQINISCKYKLHITNHFVIVYATIGHFYKMPQKIIISKIAKMVDLERSHKHMGWNG